MEFRWLVFLTLWTALSGPVLSQPGTAARRDPLPIGNPLAASSLSPLLTPPPR